MDLSFPRLPSRRVRIGGAVVAVASVALMLLAYGVWPPNDERRSGSAAIGWSHTEGRHTSGSEGGEPDSSALELTARIPSEFADVFDLPLHDHTIETIEHADSGGGGGGMRTEVAWIRAGPSVEERGLVLLFHGCSHSAASWFTLPEDRLNARTLLAHNYSLLAFSSQDRRGRRCWDDTWPLEDGRNNVDVESVVATLRVRFSREKDSGLRSSTRMFAFGASSGGTFVTILARALKLQAVIVMISPGNEEALLATATLSSPTTIPPVAATAATSSSSSPPPLLDSSVLKSAATLFPLPPTLFICMERDKQWASERILQRTRTMLLTSHPHLRGVAGTASSSPPSSASESDDSVAVWTLAPRAVDAQTLLSIDSIRTASPVCAHLFSALGHAHSSRLAVRPPDPSDQQQHEGDDDHDGGAEDVDTLLHPRTNMLRLDPRATDAVAVVQTLLQQLLQPASAPAADRPSPPPSSPPPLRFSPPSFGQSVARYSHATLLQCSTVFETESAAIAELLNERYANHEMSGRMCRQQARWMDQR